MKTFFALLFFSSCTLLTPPKKNLIFPVEVAPYAQNWDSRKVAAESAYKLMKGKVCGGLPRIDIKTAPGFCVGLLDNGEGMIFPRTAVELESDKIMLVDMGGWASLRGQLYLISVDKKNNKIKRSTVLSAGQIKDPKKKFILDRPHLILKGPDDYFYIGAPTLIARFRYKPEILTSPLAFENALEIVIDNIPAQGLHPLKSFTFDNDGNLYLNVGSATNVCEKHGSRFEKKSDCIEAEDTESGQALVRKYPQDSEGNYSSKDFSIYSRGLRNSMGLLWDLKNNLLLQAENSRDAISKFNSKLINEDLPHDELNILNDGNHYGWPYCFDNNEQNPEWQNITCTDTTYSAPYLLLPAHSAPLSIIKYQGNLFPLPYRGRFLFSFHGYEAKGHRIVTFLNDAKGLPMGDALSVVYGWEKNGNQMMGSPVGLSELSDGSVIIVEDKSKKVLRLFYDKTLGDGVPVKEIARDQSKDKDLIKREEKFNANLEKVLLGKNPPRFAVIQKNIIDKHCVSCHAGDNARGMELNRYDYAGNEARILKENKAAQIYYHMRGHETYASMPPDGFNSDEEKKILLDLYSKWLVENKISYIP